LLFLAVRFWKNDVSPMIKYFEAEELTLVHSGKDYFDIQEKIIGEARSLLHLQTYIFEDDPTAQRVAKALIAAANRGVKVYLLVDAIGSFPFSKELAKMLIGGGVHFRLFSPLFSSENIFVGRRLHHKIVVADKCTGLVGGINIADKYNDTGEGAPWLDYAVFTKGKVNEYLHLVCEQFYFKQQRNRVLGWERSLKGADKHAVSLIRYRANDWIRRKNEVHRSYVEALAKSNNSVTIVASYFLPGNRFRKLLNQAADRGVKIRLIMAGRSDLSTVRLAENYLYDFYLRNKIELFEWSNSVMHGKAMIVDDHWATIGSYNLNFLSHYASVELNAEIRDKKFIKEFSKELDKVATTLCTLVDLQKYALKNVWYRKLQLWFAFAFFRIIKNFTMLGSRRIKNKRK
jgi:cardiolipin synthase